MKKEFKIVIAAILAIWIFLIGMEVGVYKEKRAYSEKDTTVSAPVVTTEPAAQTTEPSTQVAEPSTKATEPSTVATEPSLPAANTGVSEDNPLDPSEDTTQKTTAGATDDPSSLSKEQVLEQVVKYVTQVKGEQNMTANKKEDIKVELTDLSVAAAKSIVQGIIDGLAGSEEVTYTFSGGQGTDPDGKAVTPNDVIPPTGKAFSLTDAGVASGKAEKVGDNTVYTVVLVPESTTLESPEPVHNAAAIGYLNLGGLDLPSSVQLTKADMQYPGSTVTVTVDANDKVIALKNELPMTGVGEAKVIGMSGNAAFGGALNEEWTFTY